MNSLAYTDSNIFNVRGLEHKKAVASENKQQLSKSQRQNDNKSGEVIYSDVSTASYVRGYN
jgi:hypothetical protein